MARLPFLLTIVHGGMVLPRELTARLALTPADVFFDSDPWTREIFAFGEAVQGRLETDVARSVIDLDQDPDIRPPKSADGVVRLRTRYGRPVWNEDALPNADDINRLIDRYHHQYHDILTRVASRGGVRLGIDCHSMAPVGAPYDKDPGNLRPIFCLGNLGDGEGRGAGTSCSAETLLKLAAVLENEFSDVELKDGQKLVSVNDPFSGGYILKHHRRSEGGSGALWLQLCVNRCLVLKNEPENPAEVKQMPDSDREAIAKLRMRLLNCMNRFAEVFNEK